MLEPNDTVAVALSGGKDSISLIQILHKLERRFPHARLIALTVDEGISVYRDEAISISREICNQLEIKHIVVSFAELFGVTMDEVASTQHELQPCSYCGVLRRKALNECARHAGATKLATAHNLDDEAQTGLLNLIHGDVERVLRVSSVSKKAQSRFVPRIKPLSEIPERETTLYAYASASRFQSISCPHGHDALRGEVRQILNRLELKHPGVKYTIYNSIGKLSEAASPEYKPRGFRSCSLCGNPTSSDTCEACTMLRSLKADVALAHEAAA